MSKGRVTFSRNFNLLYTVCHVFVERSQIEILKKYLTPRIESLGRL